MPRKVIPQIEYRKIVITGYLQACTHGHRDRTPFIKGPLDPEPGLDKVWRLLWRS